MAEIALEGVTKRFAETITAVDGVSLTISSGEFLVLVGPSGCGKTTLLRMIAGLEAVTEGRIVIDGRDVTKLTPRDRDVAMVFQNYALYPQMTVRQNMAFGLKVRKTPRAEIARRVDEVARLLGLEEMLDRKPASLSGGQRQRVAMGRAIVRQPRAFLMDEPLSNLDAKLRVSMRAELAHLHFRLGATTVYVTHDQVEAMTLGQRVAVMRDGVVQQVSDPQTLYRAPANVFVASFMGSPSMNLVEAVVDGGAIRFGGWSMPLSDQTVFHARARGSVILGIRPEDLEDASFAPSDFPHLEAVVAVVEELGSETLLIFTVDAPPVVTDQLRTIEDDRVLGNNKAIFTARVDPQTEARVGQSVRLAINPSRLYFFHPASGERIKVSDPELARR
jgi:multiple sugar transport system ATP-binding protein